MEWRSPLLWSSHQALSGVSRNRHHQRVEALELTEYIITSHQALQSRLNAVSHRALRRLYNWSIRRMPTSRGYRACSSTHHGDLVIKRFNYEDHLPIQWFILLFSSIIKAPLSQITQYSLLLTNTVNFDSPSSTSDSIDLLGLIILQTSTDLSTLLLEEMLLQPHLI